MRWSGGWDTHREIRDRRGADFLLAWWNSDSCGKFDFTTAWGMDDDIVDDYPDTLGYGPQFEAVVREWRRAEPLMRASRRPGAACRTHTMQQNFNH